MAHLTENAEQTTGYRPQSRIRYRVIGLVGQKYAGKDTVAQLLGYRFPNSKFIACANPVKQLFDDLASELIPEYHSYDKATQLPVLGVSKRYGYVTLGTKWGRDMIHPHLWSMILYSRIHKILRDTYTYLSEPDSLVNNLNNGKDYEMTIFVTDVRFPDEGEVVRRLNGVLLFISRTQDGKPYLNPDDPQDPADRSENSIELIERQSKDYLVFNRGTLIDLKFTMPHLATSIQETTELQTFYPEQKLDFKLSLDAKSSLFSIG